MKKGRPKADGNTKSQTLKWQPENDSTQFSINHMGEIHSVENRWGRGGGHLVREHKDNSPICTHKKKWLFLPCGLHFSPARQSNPLNSIAYLGKDSKLLPWEVKTDRKLHTHSGKMWKCHKKEALHADF